MTEADKDTTTPLVSIIIPAYNAEDYISECLSSITNQTYRNLEIIVVDDGSTDSTPIIIRDFCALDSRVSLIQQQNQYAGVARNAGMNVAIGDYLLFLDADDFFDSTMVEKMINRAQETSSDIIICKSNFFDNVTKEFSPIDFSLHDVNVSETYSGRELADCIFQFCVGWPWDKLFSASFIRRNKLQFQELRTSNDARFVFLALCLATRISFVDEILVQHRTNNEKSLERTRSKSCESAIYAADSIREYLVASDLYSQYEDSFINWYLDFTIWNLTSLENTARKKLIRIISDEKHSFLNKSVNYFTDESEKLASLLRHQTYEDLLLESFLIVHEKFQIQADLDWHKQYLRQVELDVQESELRHSKEISEIRACLGNYPERIRQLEGTLDNIYNSKSWKLIQFIRKITRMK